MEINGKAVVNATKPLVISINQRDITAATPKDPGGCAAAKAIIRQEKCKGARVHLGRVYIEFPNSWLRYETPDSLRSEVVAIDRGGTFMPGKHTLGVLKHYEAKRLGKRQGSTKGDRGTTAAMRRKRIARKHHHIEGVREHGANK